MALAFLIIGNGFFKPNVSSIVGGLYKEEIRGVMAASLFFTWGLILVLL